MKVIYENKRGVDYSSEEDQEDQKQADKVNVKYSDSIFMIGQDNGKDSYFDFNGDHGKLQGVPDSEDLIYQSVDLFTIMKENNSEYQ